MSVAMRNFCRVLGVIKNHAASKHCLSLWRYSSYMAEGVNAAMTAAAVAGLRAKRAAKPKQDIESSPQEEPQKQQKQQSSQPRTDQQQILKKSELSMWEYLNYTKKAEMRTPRLDETHYKPTDQSRRIFQQTWAEFDDCDEELGNEQEKDKGKQKKK